MILHIPRHDPYSAEIEGSCHMVQPCMMSRLSTPFEPYFDRNFLS